MSAHASDAEATPSTQPYTNLMPIKGFVHDMLHKSCTSCNMRLPGGHLSQIPELIKKGENNGEGVHGEPDLSGELSKVTSRLKSGRNLLWIPSWPISYTLMQLSLLQLLLNQIQWAQERLWTVMNCTWATHRHLLPPLKYQIHIWILTGLKSHLVQNITKRHKLPSPPFLHVAPQRICTIPALATGD